MSLLIRYSPEVAVVIALALAGAEIAVWLTR
jgi:hypothetical protein